MAGKVFVGSSGEALNVCRAVQQELEREFEVTVWDQGVFRPTYDGVSSLLRQLDASDAGVFVLTPDDITESRGHTWSTARDNVVFELGLFLGRLGQQRTFLVAPRGTDLHLPTDLTGITVVHYDGDRFTRGERRPAIATACTRIAEALLGVEPDVVPEPKYRARLDRALTRMSKDLEHLACAGVGTSDGSETWPGPQTVRLGRAVVHIERGRIEDYRSAVAQEAIVLPANEYFDDGCIADATGSLGAFVKAHFDADVARFTEQIERELTGRPTRRVYRSEHQTDDSYGIGEAIFLKALRPDHRLVLASVTTERSGVGLNSEPQFVYAALESVVEVMNQHRLNSCVLPVLGSGHGEISLGPAILFNLLAIRSILTEDHGRHVKTVRLVVFDGVADTITATQMRGILSVVGTAGPR